MSKFVGLEALDNITEEKDQSTIIVGAGIEDAIELITAVEALDMEVVALEDLEATFDEGFAALADVQRLHDNIKENGISRPLMAFADPSGYLTKTLGLPALEDLDITPIKDANTELAMEAMSDKLKKWGDAILKFFKMILDQIKSMFSKVINMFKSYEKILTGLEGKLKNITLDADKAKEKKVTALKIADLEKLYKVVLSGTSDELNKLAVFAAGGGGNDEELKGVFGKLSGFVLSELGLKVNTDKTGLEESEYPYEAKEDTVAGHGFTVDSAITALGESKKVATKMATAKDAGAAVKKAADAVAKELKSLEKLTDDKDEGKVIKTKISNTQAAIKAYNKLTGVWLKKAKYVVNQSITISNAVIACNKGE